MGGKAKKFTNVSTNMSDSEIFGELINRGYLIVNPDKKGDREMAITVVNIKTGAERPMRKLSLLCPQTSPLWWKNSNE